MIAVATPTRQEASKTVNRQDLEKRMAELLPKLEKAMLWLYGDEPGAPPGSAKWQEGLSRYEKIQREWKAIKFALDQIAIQEQGYSLKLRSLYDVLLFTAPPFSLVEYLESRQEELSVDILAWLQRWADIRGGGPSPVDDMPGRAG